MKMDFCLDLHKGSFIVIDNTIISLHLIHNHCYPVLWDAHTALKHCV